VVLLLGLCVAGRAELLPIRTYTTADGIVHDRISRIVRDSKGFLWFCTAVGLSRFDGYRFTTILSERDIEGPSVNDLLETSGGVYWVATNGSGILRFNTTLRDSSNPGRTTPEEEAGLFRLYRVGEGAPDRVNVLFEDREGRIWAGTDGGLFVFDAAAEGFAPVLLGIPSLPDLLVQVWTFGEDGEGRLWIGTKYGLVCRLADGHMLHFEVRPTGQGTDIVYALEQDSDGRFWVGHENGLFVFKPLAASAPVGGPFAWRTLLEARPSSGGQQKLTLPQSPGEAARFTTLNGLGSNLISAVHMSSNGRVYITCNGGGLTEFDGQRFRNAGTREGLTALYFSSLAEDPEGNLWIGTNSTGAMKLARSGLTTYTKADGLGSTRVVSMFDDKEGNSYGWAEWLISRFDGRQFTAVRPNLPARFSALTFKSYNRILRHSSGEWWVSTNEGLFRFPKVETMGQLARARPKALYTTSDGLAANDVTYLFEDSRGDIWIATFAPGREVLTRWERASGQFRRFSDEDGLKPLLAANCFREDAAGNLWVGFQHRVLARYREGRFTLVPGSDVLDNVLDIYLDRKGRLWLASAGGGLYRVDDPSAERPAFKRYTIEDGLGSNRLTSITEDDFGNIYIATRRGVDRLNPETSEVKHYTVADGLGSTEILSAYRDRKGNLWFGCFNGLSRLVPAPDLPTPPAPVFISGLRVAGASYPVSIFGESEVNGPDVGPGQSQIQVDFFGLNFSSSEPLRYQYKIEGRSADWSAPTDQRTIDLSLAPGAYRFLVRAISPGGAVSPMPAAVSFTVLRPVWQRWWFVTLAGAAIALMAYGAFRYRVMRLIELERVRTRIATDLHDDIGASLSRMAILSEVVKHQTQTDHQESAGMLAEIAESARSLVDSMSDIVWSIDPRKDDLKNVVTRIRAFASDVLEARGIEWEFKAPEDLEQVKLPPDTRRHLFLIFKEAITNIARHSGSTRANVRLQVEHHRLCAEIADNGRGFSFPACEPNHARLGGNGLTNMSARAVELGGELRIDSAPGRGTKLKLTVPI
jgi:ligand-binding sensor domain-containing protein/two-component sensor histidine kinase